MQEPAAENLSQGEKATRAREWYDSRSERQPRQKWMNGHWVKMVKP